MVLLRGKKLGLIFARQAQDARAACHHNAG
jgi:hypothetical protein